MSDGLKLLRAITEQGASETLREITPELLMGEEEVAAFDFIRGHYRLYSEMPETSTVRDETGVTLPRANEIAQFYYDRCYDRKMFTTVREPFNELRTALMNNDADLARELISDMAQGVRLSNAEQDLLTMSETGEAVMRHHDEHRFQMGLSGAATGWPTLDRKTDGWQPGDLILLVARPGIGKTHLLIHAARHAWMSGKKVLFISMEMTLKQIGIRFFAQHAGVDPDAFRKSKLSNVALRKVENAMAEMEGDNRFHLFAGNFKEKRTAEVDALIQEINPDIIFIDGLYLMNPVEAPRNVNRHEKVAYVADEIKRVALHRSRPIVGTVQFNREAGKGGKHGGLENLGGSDALSQHGSIIIGAKFPPNEEDMERPPHRVLSVLKGREGESGDIAINFKFTPVDFSECGAEETKEVLAAKTDRNAAMNMDHMA